MKDYTTNKRYCPHEITTKFNSVQVYRQTGDITQNQTQSATTNGFV